MRVPALLLITDPATDVVAITRAALEGAPPGRVAVQLRDKSASAADLAEAGRALLAIGRAAGALLVINDRVDVARAIGADGVHLPERGLDVRDARSVLGPGRLVSCSRHDEAGLARAAAEGADYATLAPIFAVPGKGPPLGVEGLRAAARLAMPVLALGGITPRHVPALLAAGARGIAVSRAVYASERPAEAVRALLDALDRAGGSAAEA